MPRDVVQVKSFTPVGADKKNVTELLCQTLEAELGAVQIYEAAILLAGTETLRSEWESCLAETQEHARTLRVALRELGVPSDTETPGRALVRESYAGTVQALAGARQDASPSVAQLLAADAIFLVTTKARFNWRLIGDVAQVLQGNEGGVLQSAHDATDEEKEEHVEQATQWARDLWLAALGLLGEPTGIGGRPQAEATIAPPAGPREPATGPDK